MGLVDGSSGLEEANVPFISCQLCCIQEQQSDLRHPVVECGYTGLFQLVARPHCVQHVLIFSSRLVHISLPWQRVGVDFLIALRWLSGIEWWAAVNIDGTFTSAYLIYSSRSPKWKYVICFSGTRRFYPPFVPPSHSVAAPRLVTFWAQLPLLTRSSPRRSVLLSLPMSRRARVVSRATPGGPALRPPDSQALGCWETECHRTSGCLHVTQGRRTQTRGWPRLFLASALMCRVRCNRKSTWWNKYVAYFDMLWWIQGVTSIGSSEERPWGVSCCALSMRRIIAF